ncbi:hypothetical protein [Haliscomenobacter hydrossis]|uniref:hypothetical protein n=1 Tax=Haliscomenobacter hydrossis TaxID=2350 RepID=UPI0011D22DB0
MQTLQQVFAANPDEFNALILLSQDQERILKDEILGLKDASFETRKNALNNRLLSLIDRIREEDASAYVLAESRFQKILVVCKMAERQTFMEKLLPPSRWKSVHIDCSQLPLHPTRTQEYELIIFDNYPFDTDQGQHTLLRHYLAPEHPYLLYFGTQLPFLNDYPEKVYFSNSIFSFHSRLQEMVNYLQNISAVLGTKP